MMSTIETRGPTFEFIAGLWILFLGIYLYISGLEYVAGMTINTVGDTQTVVYNYVQIVSPFSTYKILWCIPFFALGIYIMYLAMTKPHPNKK